VESKLGPLITAAIYCPIVPMFLLTTPWKTCVAGVRNEKSYTDMLNCNFCADRMLLHGNTKAHRLLLVQLQLAKPDIMAFLQPVYSLDLESCYFAAFRGPQELLSREEWGVCSSGSEDSVVGRGHAYSLL
jgi:hypothetical protein